MDTPPVVNITPLLRYLGELQRGAIIRFDEEQPARDLKIAYEAANPGETVLILQYGGKWGVAVH